MARILIIDDEEMVRRSVAMVLRMKGFDTQMAEGGREGLEEARRCRPDLIVCDMNMPFMDGLETLAQVRMDPQLQSVPVVMITGREGREDEALRLGGAQALLLKPFNNEDLIHHVTTFLNPDRGMAGPLA